MPFSIDACLVQVFYLVRVARRDTYPEVLLA